MIMLKLTVMMILAGVITAPAYALDAARPAAPDSQPNQPAAGEKKPSPEKPAYQDRVISEEEASRPETMEEINGGKQETPGRKAFSAIYNFGATGSPGVFSRTEHGLELRSQKETIDYGNFDLVLAGFHSHDIINANNVLKNDLITERRSERFTLTQSQFAFNERLVMENAAGAIYTQGAGLIGRSFRTNLSSSPVNGVSNRTFDLATNTEYSLVAGSIGQFSGSVASGFRSGNGSLAGMGIQRKFNSNWNGAIQIWNVEGSSYTPDHSSMSIAGAYIDPAGRNRLQLRGITDSRDRKAVWFDGEVRSPGSIHHYGFSRFQNGVAWADFPIANGYQSAYWRHDSRTLSRAYTLGADYTESNYERIGNQPTIKSTVVYGSINERIDRITNAGGALNLRSSTTLNPALVNLAAASVRASRIDGFVFGSRITGLGASRLQINHSQSIEGANDKTTGIQWDQEFLKLGMATSLSFSKEKNGQDSIDRIVGAVLFRGLDIGQAYLTGSVNAFQSKASSGNIDSGLQVNANLRWQINRNWSMSTNLSFRKTFREGGGAPDASQNDASLMFVVRYDDVSGTPYYGPASMGPKASSRIFGTIFFDENNDGVRQASEQPVPNVIVVLDGAYRAQTDANGRFEFYPVRPGTRSISIQMDRIPLPWGLLDDSPRNVEASLRDATEINIPIIRLSQ